MFDINYRLRNDELFKLFLSLWQEHEASKYWKEQLWGSSDMELPAVFPFQSDVRLPSQDNFW